MTIAMDGPLRLRDGTSIAALSEISSQAHGVRDRFWLLGRKTPVALLICAGGNIRAFDLDNRPLTEADLDALCCDGPANWRERLGSSEPSTDL
ncbi:MAG: hypothetical protein R3E87_25975 [Burkholderiaceae bacterium]